MAAGPPSAPRAAPSPNRTSPSHPQHPWPPQILNLLKSPRSCWAACHSPLSAPSVPHTAFFARTLSQSNGQPREVVLGGEKHPGWGRPCTSTQIPLHV